MTQTMIRSIILLPALLLVAVLTQLTVVAGPPLICHTIEIGDAKSLPWGSSAEWRAVKPNYDLNRLADETTALLTPNMPILVRMETLRRATIYAVWSQYDREVGLSAKNSQVAEDLLGRLMSRVREAVGKKQEVALALFDAGYLMACYQQASYRATKNADAQKALDAYAMVRKAAAHRGDSPEIEFAAALIGRSPEQPTYRGHLQKAVAGAQEGSLLARNLLKHFGQRGQSLADLRAQVAVAR
ncbi:MAG TPA: hypothetical protein VJ302_12040 [Blastocatellia bacterium]|nr:hypothetical protein [Blastocatellia bacterium]